MPRLAVLILFAIAACHGPKSPEMHVLGVHEAPRHDVVFVEVTNPASKTMRVTKLEYKFAAAGTTVAQGELEMVRDVPAESSIVVEVPLDSDSKQPMELEGTLTAELDQIVRIFRVSAQIQPQKIPATTPGLPPTCVRGRCPCRGCGSRSCS